MTLVGTTTRVTHASPHGGVVFRLQPDTNSPNIRVRAAYDVLRDAPDIGDRFSVTGAFEQGHYGRQLIATAVLPEPACNASIHSLLLRNHAFAHIRMHTKEQLSERLGPLLLPALSDCDVLSLIRAGAKFGDAQELVAAWLEYSSTVATRRFLLEHGLGQQTASMAANLWGIEAIDTVRRNPYCLLAVARWDQVDAAATNTFGCAEDDERRYLGFADAIFNDAATRGRAALFASEFKELVNLRVGYEADADAIFAACIRAKRMRVVQGVRHQYIQGATLSKIEAQIQSRLNSMLAPRKKPPNATRKSLVLLGLEGISDRLRWHLRNSPIVLVNMPGAAASATAELLSSITEEVVVVAPTLSFTRNTSDDTLVYRLSEFVGGGNTPNVTGKVVVVLEASMLDLLMANKLLRSVAGAAKLVLIGDRKLRPAFGPGHIFPALEKSGGFPTIDATEVLNSPTTLAPLAALPAKLHPKATLQSIAELVHHVPVESMQELMSIALKHYRGIFEESPTEGIIIATTRSIVTSLNNSMHEEVLDYAVSQGGDDKTISLQGKQMATVGDLVVYTSRDFSRGLFHGSRGLVTEVFTATAKHKRRNPAAVARVEFDTAGVQEISVRDCQSMTLGHAVQGHHASMSRWRTVVIAAAPSQNITNSWVWRSAMRATDKLVIVELSHAFQNALTTDASDSTYMPLSDWRPQ